MTWRVAALLAAGAALVPALPSPGVGVLVVSLVVLLAAALDVALAGAVGDLRLRREGASQVRLDDTAEVALVVTNTGVRTVRAEIRDAWVPSAGASPYAHHVDLDPDESARLVTTLHPTRRGDRPAVRVTIRSYGPLRLAYRQVTGRRADAMTPAWRLRVREYVIGDDVRSIDWRASARRSDVIVRTWRPERDRRVLCVIDTGRTSAARVATVIGNASLDEPRLDAAIDAALLLATLANRAGDRVDLLAIDTAVRAAVEGGTSRNLLPRLVNAMAPLQPALVETDFGLVAGEVLRRERKRALVVLFTALEAGALGEGLLPVLTQLTARHKVLLAAVHDPAVTELAARRGDAPGVYAAAAAHRTLAERDRLQNALRRHEVEVIDAPADLFASQVADAYLAMKAAGRL
ncbi:MAG: hypothetical protein AUI14_21220 [Actinobacteria bacterium 13_2_20CM_2_71_6]|nr:MAG: hypothetical protein AUI14_21220 [Actinobacteria bacterium 13_2_20CM_2_71_6]